MRSSAQWTGPITLISMSPWSLPDQTHIGVVAGISAADHATDSPRDASNPTLSFGQSDGIPRCGGMRDVAARAAQVLDVRVFSSGVMRQDGRQ